MNKKGFTLIELVTVIVVLAIITLIVIPITTNVVENSKKSAAKSSALNYIKAVEATNALVELPGKNNEFEKITGTNDVVDIKVSTNGRTPDNGTIKVDDDGKVQNAKLCIDGYQIIYEGSKITEITKPDECDLSPKYPTGALVYFDPVKNASCDAESFDISNVNNGSSTCYKWRILSVENSDLVLQLDHNIVNKIYLRNNDFSYNGIDLILNSLANSTSSWNVPLLDYEYDTSMLTDSYGKLTCTNGICKINKNGVDTQVATNVKARLITGEELKNIVVDAGAPSNSKASLWTLSNTYSPYYFARGGRPFGNNSSGSGSSCTSKLSWLLENTTVYSCSNATNNSYNNNNEGYWTLSPLNRTSDVTSYYRIYYAGNFESDNLSYSSYFGLRPVIKIKKKKILSDSVVPYDQQDTALPSGCGCLDGELEVIVYDEEEKKRKKKKLKDITYDDLILVWNFDKGCFEWAKALCIMNPRKFNESILLKFSDGTSLKAIGDHRIYNDDAKKFTSCRFESDTPIGTTTINSNGEKISLVSREFIKEEIYAYNVITDKHINLYANGILTSRGSNNLYPINDMKFVKEDRETFSKADFDNIPDEYFYGLRLDERSRTSNGTEEETKQHIEAMINQLITNKKL